MVIYVFFIVGLFIIVYVKEVYFKLVGICIIFLGVGIGEVLFFILIVYYEKVMVVVYLVGIGLGFILGFFYYIGMFKVFLCLFVSYWVMYFFLSRCLKKFW